MKIPCFRCGKKIKDANPLNADYIIASDTLVREQRDVLIALKHNQNTLEKRGKLIKDNTDINDEGDLFPPTEDFLRNQFADSEYDAVIVPNIRTAQDWFNSDLVKIIAETRRQDIQKTGLICHKCYKTTDTVIWGIHKE